MIEDVSEEGVLPTALFIFAKLAQVSEAQIWLELIKVDFSQGGDFKTGNMKVNNKY